MENVLYHYTNSQALTNILNTGLLRATHARYFADASDCRHAIEVARQLEPKLKSYKIFNSLENCIINNPRYVISLSKNENDPYLWDNYGQKGHGACIVIDSNKLRELKPNGIWDEIICCYDQDYQVAQLKEIIPNLINCDSSIEFSSMNKFWELCMTSKDIQYAKESEIRKIFTPQKQQYIDNCSKNEQISDEVEIFNRDLNIGIEPHYFDEKMRPFMNLQIKDAIKEVMFGQHFKFTLPYLRFLESQYTIRQLGADKYYS